MNANGLPAMTSVARNAVRALREDLAFLRLSPVDVALPFALAVDAETIIVGVDDVMQLDEIAMASKQHLSDSVLEVLARHACPDQLQLIDPRTW